MSTEEPIEGPGDHPPEKKPSLARRWRYFSRRHAIIAGLILGVGAFAVLLLAFLLYRLGYVDRYVVGQIQGTFANYDIVRVLTAGGPRNMTHVLATYAFRLGIESGDVPLGSAVSLVMLPILGTFAIFILRGVRQRAREI